MNKAIFTSYNFVRAAVYTMICVAGYLLSQYFSFVTSRESAQAAREAVTRSTEPNFNGYRIEEDVIVNQDNGFMTPIPRYETFFEAPTNWYFMTTIVCSLMVAFFVGLLVHRSASTHVKKHAGSTEELATN